MMTSFNSQMNITSTHSAPVRPRARAHVARLPAGPGVGVAALGSLALWAGIIHVVASLIA